MLSLGSKIPDFTLEIYHKDKMEKVNGTHYLGKWLVVVFYPGDFTFVCPTELEGFADAYSEFTAQGAEILSVSTNNIFDHKHWHETSPSIKKIKFPMGADPTGKLCRAFGIYDEETGSAARATFVFDSEGILRLIEANEDRVGRDVKETLRKLIAAKYVSVHPNEMCPEGWKPGKKTIKRK